MARRCETCPMLDRCNEAMTGVCMMEDIDEAMLAENTAGSAGDDSSYLYEFIFEACEYFSSLGYICNSSEIFSVISDMHGGQMDVKKLLSAMITHSYKEALMFNRDVPDSGCAATESVRCGQVRYYRFVRHKRVLYRKHVCRRCSW